ncbi:carbohydrate ABC transporter permease [Paramicrobacterium chengjingii]|uniref:Sugar ABC transporter permease n=1 Tax=Paramicrobacterium chengjingii TaxID=2769067 RepID=A0ABX6YHK3_9MICO|nr:sugar ABC transporter permease [Microbacterium chengjingii]QPZ38253.1 sugar ABC transporter permease [Microbacterium chengjingii]
MLNTDNESATRTITTQRTNPNQRPLRVKRAKSLTKSRVEPYIFILPTVALFAVVLIIPIANLTLYSLGDSNLFQGFTGWNNFENFSYLASAKFLQTVLVTVIWLVGGVVGIVVCGLAIALALNKPIKGRTLFRALVIIPWIVPHAFAGAMWSWVLQPQFGILNRVLVTTGLVSEPISFLDADSALATVIIVRIWQGAPFMIITLLAGLQTIPNEIEEAAQIDGATWFQRLRYITLPHLRPVLTVSTLIVAAWTLQVFDTVYVMTNGGPARSTQIIALDIYSKVFIESDLGSGAAMALVTLIVVSVMSWRALRKEGQETV